jgi:hypothetical protein
VTVVAAFDASQLRELKMLGVLDSQVSRLLNILPLCQARVLRPPDRNSVLGLLEAIAGAGAKLDRALAAVTSEGARSAAKREARAQILLAGFERREASNWPINHEGEARRGRSVDDLAAARAALLVLNQSTRAALTSLRSEPQRRRRSATPEPVRLINDALLRGWGEAYYPVGTGEYTSPQAPVPPVPAYPLAPSSSPTSRFRQVVSICYQAFLGVDDADPERAIKSYLKIRSAALRRARGRTAGA